MTAGLTIVHILFVMTGYAGLIAANAWLLSLCRSNEPATVAAGVRTWRILARVFGPLLGLGVLAGFALAVNMGFPLTALWLVIAYGLIVVGLATQAAIMVPWQLRAESTIANGGVLSVRPIVVVLTVLTLAYAAIASLMVVRPM